MGETQNLRHQRVEKYDPLVGRYSRDIKTTDIVVVGTKKTPTATGTWAFSSTVPDANHQLFPYIFTVHSTNTAAQFVVLNNSSTVLSLQIDSRRSESLVTDCNCPFFRVAPLSTVSILIPGVTSTADTYAAFLICKKEPIVSVVEN